MSKKLRNKFSIEQRQKAVEDYIAVIRTSPEIVKDLDVEVQAIYWWETVSEEKTKGVGIDESEENGCFYEIAKPMSQLEEEVVEYEKKKDVKWWSCRCLHIIQTKKISCA